jgi:hypothetical protein
MSYANRVYRQRNAHTHDEAKNEPFFKKQYAVNNDNKKSGFFQTKLSVNQPGDSYEKEADAVASTVVNRSSQIPVVQQKKNQQHYNDSPHQWKMKNWVLMMPACRRIRKYRRNQCRLVKILKKKN